MGRFLLTVILGLALFAGVAWYFDLWPADGPPTRTDGARNNKTKDKVPPPDLGEPLYPVVKAAVKPVAGDGLHRPDPIAVIPGQLGVVDRVGLSPQVDGILLFIGEEVPDAVIAVAGVAPFMMDPFRYATITLGERQVPKFYRRLREDMSIESNQIVAMLDPSRAALDLKMKRAKLRAAEKEQSAAKGIADESKARMDRSKRLHFVDRAIPVEEFTLSVVTFQKYLSEWEMKGEGIKIAQAEVEMAEQNLRWHEIRNTISLPSSKIRALYKNSGDTVKANEPIMEVVASYLLQAEGMAEVEYANKIRRARRVFLEPSQEEAPAVERLKAHHGEITGVAFTRDGKIVSGSEDTTVRLWSRPKPVDRMGNLMSADEAKKTRPWTYTPPQIWRELPHHEVVLSVATSPPASKINWCAAGCNDGSIYLWNLDNAKAEPVILKNHTDRVYALAFSPDGQWLASGGADNVIRVWRVQTQKEEYALNAKHGVESTQQHRGQITSLHFTPRSKLVSAGRDHTLRVWDLHQRGARLVHRQDGRSNMVNQLGVDREGKWMIYDKPGHELQVLSVEDGQYLCSLQNPHAAIAFETVAAFSPDASLLLTAGTPEGRLQLWQTPTQGSRGFELRQYVPSSGDKSAVSCAAFSPDAGLTHDGDAGFVVTGSKSGSVYIWAVPNKTEVADHRILATRDPLLASNQDNPRQVRVTVELPNPADEQHPGGRLTAGRPVTIVIE